MTNLEALRILPAEQIADFLTEQRMIGLRVFAEHFNQPIEGMDSQIKAMFMGWLTAECEA